MKGATRRPEARLTWGNLGRVDVTLTVGTNFGAAPFGFKGADFSSNSRYLSRIPYS